MLDIFATLSQHFRTVKNKKNVPAAIVELHNISIPIHKRTDVKNGKTYAGFLFFYMKDGRRIQVRRATLADAEAAAKDAIRGMVAARGSSFTVTPAEHAELTHALSMLRQHPGASLTSAITQWHEAAQIVEPRFIVEACKAYQAQKEKETGFVPATVQDVFQGFIRELEHEDASTRYIDDCKSRMGRIAKTFRSEIHTVTSEEIAEWIANQKVAMRTRKNFRCAFVTLWKYAKRKKHLPRDRQTEAELVGGERKKKSSRIVSPIGIYSPEAITKILATAPEHLVAVFAIGAFAGLRQAEIHRLKWQDVKADHIVIQSENSKTASRRIVPILPNLRAWLSTVERGDADSRLCFQYSHENALARAMTAAIRDAGVAPVHNGLRHSFCSYRLSAVQSADQVALEAGNSPKILFTNYRELVTPEDAAAWFAVAPEPLANVVALSDAAA
jgi:integrase